MRPDIRWLRQKLKDFPVSVRCLQGTKRRAPGSLLSISMIDKGRITAALYARIRDVIPGNRCYTWGAHEITVARVVVATVIEVEQGCQPTTVRG